MTTRYWGLGAIAVLVAGLCGSARAETIAKLGDFQDWSAYRAESDAGPVCYAVSQPGRRSGSGAGHAYAYVSNRPAKSANGVVMLRAGYVYQNGSDVKVEIGKRRFTLFTDRDTAWADTDAADHRLVEGLKAGKTMVVRGVTQDGAAREDTYSLDGFAAALDSIAAACAVR